MLAYFYPWLEHRLLPEAVVSLGASFSSQGYNSWITPSVSWYSTDSRCRRESRLYHEEPISVAFYWFSCLILFAPLVCFCCSLQYTPSITWPIHYRLGVFNIEVESQLGRSRRSIETFSQNVTLNLQHLLMFYFVLFFSGQNFLDVAETQKVVRSLWRLHRGWVDRKLTTYANLFTIQFFCSKSSGGMK